MAADLGAGRACATFEANGWAPPRRAKKEVLPSCSCSIPLTARPPKEAYQTPLMPRIWEFKSEERVEPFAYAGILSAEFAVGGRP